jgi:hypothetical protein
VLTGTAIALALYALLPRENPVGTIRARKLGRLITEAKGLLLYGLLGVAGGLAVDLLVNGLPRVSRARFSMKQLFLAILLISLTLSLLATYRLILDR